MKGRFSRVRKFGIVFIKHKPRVTAGSEENIKVREEKTNNEIDAEEGDILKKKEMVWDRMLKITKNF
jgi:hypothetical protein